MDRHDIRKRAVDLYADEVQYAIARDDEVDLSNARARAALRLGRWMEGQDMSLVWGGYIEGIARTVERGFEIDITTGQLSFGAALRVRDLTFVPTDRARLRDWLALDSRQEQKQIEHAKKREHQRDFNRAIIERLRAHGGDPTTFEACPDLFASREAA